MKMKTRFALGLLAAFTVIMTGCESTGAKRAFLDTNLLANSKEEGISLAEALPSAEEVTPGAKIEVIETKDATGSETKDKARIEAENRAKGEARMAAEVSLREGASQEEKASPGKISKDQASADKPPVEKVPTEKHASDKVSTEKPFVDVAALADSPAERPASRSERTEGAVVADKAPLFEGKVVLVNQAKKFLIVDFREAKVPPVRSELGVYRGGVFVGSLRITEPVKPPLASADILSGTLRRGDVVQ